METKKDTNFEEIKNGISENAQKAFNFVTEKVSNAVEWGINNPEKVVAGVTLTIGVLKASQSLVVSHRVSMERKRIDHTYYDPSTGMHWDLRRAATNADRAEILRRKALGDSVPQILMDLKLIKL